MIKVSNPATGKWLKKAVNVCRYVGSFVVESVLANNLYYHTTNNGRNDNLHPDIFHKVHDYLRDVYPGCLLAIIGCVFLGFHPFFIHK